MTNSRMWSVFLATISLQVLGSFLYFVLLKDGVAIQAGYFVIKAAMFTAPLVLLYTGFALPKFTLKPNLQASLLWGFGSGIAIAGLILGTYFLFENFFAQFSGTILSKVVEIGIQNVYWPVAIAISSFHSLFEEYFVRWYMVKGLETRLTLIKSILIANTIFAIHHYIILSQFVSWPLVILFGTFVGVGGCIWSYIYHRTGSLLGAWISHACADVAIFIIGYLLIAQ